MVVIADLNTSEAADKALEARLYVEGWRLKHLLIKAILNTFDKEYTGSKVQYLVFLAIDDQKDNLPVGVIALSLVNKEVMFFVRSDYRRQGVGRLLFARLRSECAIPVKEYNTSEGENGSIDFFFSLGLVTDELMDEEALRHCHG